MAYSSTADDFVIQLLLQLIATQHLHEVRAKNSFKLLLLSQKLRLCKEEKYDHSKSQHWTFRNIDSAVIISSVSKAVQN